MPRSSKGTARTTKARAGAPRKSAEKKAPLPAMQLALDAARAERARAMRDLESVQLELAEQKRRTSQQQLLAAEALKDARQDRDRLLLQLEVLQAKATSEPPEKPRARADHAERVRLLEQGLAAAESALAELRGRISGEESARRAAEDALAKLREEQLAAAVKTDAERGATAVDAKEEKPPIAPLDSMTAAPMLEPSPLPSPTPAAPPASMPAISEPPPSMPPPSLPLSAPPPAVPLARSSFFHRLFGRRRPDQG